MKAKTKKIRGHEAWRVIVGGKVVGEVFRQGTGDGLFLPFRPAVPTGKVHLEDGPTMRLLQAQSTLEGAAEAVRLATAATKVATSDVSDRVTFIGVGMTQKKADQFAAGIRRRMKGGDR